MTIYEGYIKVDRHEGVLNQKTTIYHNNKIRIFPAFEIDLFHFRNAEINIKVAEIARK
jgi:hypothetical protein